MCYNKLSLSRFLPNYEIYGKSIEKFHLFFLLISLNSTRKVKSKMKSTGIVRNVDELGRIVIPKEIRTKQHINNSDPIEIYVDGDCIILKKYEHVCLFCQSKDNLINFKGKKVCSACIDEMKF